MEIVIKCDQSEEAVVQECMTRLCPNIKDILYKDIEIRSLDVKFLKNNEEIYLSMTPDMSMMTIRKLSAVGNVFNILWHIMNDSLADLIDRMGEFDVLINGEFLEGSNDEEEIPEELTNLFRSKSNIPTVAFPGI